MLAISYHRRLSKIPWDHRMGDLPEATSMAKRLLEQDVSQRTVVAHLEGYGYSFYLALGALAAAKEQSRAGAGYVRSET
jgi:hypothetical protein